MALIAVPILDLLNYLMDKPIALGHQTHILYVIQMEDTPAITSRRSNRKCKHGNNENTGCQQAAPS